MNNIIGDMIMEVMGEQSIGMPLIFQCVANSAHATHFSVTVWMAGRLALRNLVPLSRFNSILASPNGVTRDFKLFTSAFSSAVSNNRAVKFGGTDVRAAVSRGEELGVGTFFPFKDTRSGFGMLGNERSNYDADQLDERHATGDTIAAIVTPTGGQPGAVGIVRLSGLLAVSIATRIFVPARRSTNGRLGGCGLLWSPQSHCVEFGTLVDASGALVDEVLLVPMLAPRSYTKEDVIELQCHGADICVHRVLQVCLEAGARLAQPGEFTFRAYLNGRLDLAQAENIAQLITARTVAAAETALAGIQGALSSFVHQLRIECIEMLTELEARLDFEDELPNLEAHLLITKINSIWHRVQEALETEKRGRLLQVGLQVAIVGRPNVGKSSLLNAWSQSERAIVTDVAGTTRDVIEVGIVVKGFPIKLLDTAGIRKTDDIVENKGVQRSLAAAVSADVIVMVISALDGWTTEDALIFERLWGKCTDQRIVQARHAPSILVFNKIDQGSETSIQLPDSVKSTFSKCVSTCATKSIGLEDLEEALLNLVGAGEVLSGGRQWAVNQRQAEQLLRASDALQRVKDSMQQDLPFDFWTIDIKEAATALGQISGEEVSEEVLSRIFSKFCIGK